MLIDSNSLVSMTEANQNFSKVARMVDARGAAVILRNNKPRYLVVDFNAATEEEADDATVLEVSQKLIEQNREAYEALAK